MANEIYVLNKNRQRMSNERDIYIGRPSALGNPFVMYGEHMRDKVVQQYAEWLDNQIASGNPDVVGELNRIGEMVLDGSGEAVGLVCFCSPKACHGDVIKRVIEQAIKEQSQ